MDILSAETFREKDGMIFRKSSDIVIAIKARKFLSKALLRRACALSSLGAGGIRRTFAEVGAATSAIYFCCGLQAEAVL